MLSIQEQNNIYNLDKSRMIRYIKRNYPKYDAEAIYDDTMYKVITKYDQYQGNDDTTLIGWIWTILYRTIVDHMRMNRRYYDNIVLPETMIERGYEDTHQRFIHIEYINKLIEYLPNQKYKDIFRDFIDGYKHKELSQKYNISEGTTKWYINNSRRIINSKIQLYSWMSKY